MYLEIVSSNRKYFVIELRVVILSVNKIMTSWKTIASIGRFNDYICDNLTLQPVFNQELCAQKLVWVLE